MALDERQRADALDRLLGPLPGDRSGVDVDEGMVDLARLTRQLQTASAISPLFPDPWQGWQEVRAASRLSAQLGTKEAFAPFGPFSPNGSAARTAPDHVRSRVARPSGGWMANQLATAALLLITLLVGIVALLGGIRAPRVDAVQSPAFVRAIAAVPGSIADTPLVEARFAPGELPRENPVVIFYQLEIAPGTTLPNLVGPSSRDPASTAAPSAGAEAVLSGTYSLRFDAPFRVQRRGAVGDSREIAARTEVVLHPGDAAIYPDYAASGEIRNAGPDPVVIVGVAIVPGDCLCVSSAPSLADGVTGEQMAMSLPSDWDKLPDGPVGVTLRQVILPPGATIGPYEPVGLESVWVEDGTLWRSLFQPGNPEPSGPAFVLLEKRAIPFTGTPPGIRQSLTSGEEVPAELFVVTIEPAGFWPALPVP